RSCTKRWRYYIRLAYWKKTMLKSSNGGLEPIHAISECRISNHISQFYNVDVHNSSVLRWIQRFAEVVSPFVNGITPPHLSGIYHVDEMMIHVRREKMEVGHYQWLWNMMDNTTRFWISGIVSQRREIADARKVFQDAKTKTANVTAIIHDGLWSYDEAFQKEYFTLKNRRVHNVRSISVRNQGFNSKVERLNGTMREREKVMRGMQNKQTAQKVLEAMRIYYNHCRMHSKLKTTPAERAGIRIESKNSNKIEKLIRLSRTGNTHF
ncbi:MAG: IS6 family transposase, partial [Nitrososphaeraceae archaeon]